MYACMCACAYVCYVYTCMCICMYVYMVAHACIYTRIWELERLEVGGFPSLFLVSTCCWRGMLCFGPTCIDNQACIAMAKMPVFSEKQKTFQCGVVTCASLQCCSNKMVEPRHIGARSEVADIGTNAVLEPASVMLRTLKFHYIWRVPRHVSDVLFFTR